MGVALLSLSLCLSLLLLHGSGQQSPPPRPATPTHWGQRVAESPVGDPGDTWPMPPATGHRPPAMGACADCRLRVRQMQVGSQRTSQAKAPAAQHPAAAFLGCWV